MIEGSLTSPILFITDFQRVDCAAEGKPMGGGLRQLLDSAIRRAGLEMHNYAVACIHPRTPAGGKDLYRFTAAEREQDLATFKELLAQHQANVIVLLGDYALEQLAGLTSITKWQSSVVQLKAEYGGRKAIPAYHPEHLQKMFSDSAFLTLACQKARQEMTTPQSQIPQRSFLLSPSFKETMQYLDDVVAPAPLIALDYEFSGGLINTVGFAVSAREAIAIKTLPDNYSPEEFHKLWLRIAGLCESDQPKVVQHFITEASWSARYGFELNGVVHDTMWAMKFLHPEFDKGLDNVGRMYTPFPYWKDDNDDWSQIRDWQRHLDYNCKDTTGTFAAYEAQIIDLRDRGLLDLFQRYIMRFAPVIQEMCTVGLRLDVAARERLAEKLQREQENAMRILEMEFGGRLNRTVNPRSPKQLQAALKDLGLKLPTKHSKTTGQATETTDKKALVKLRRKYPNEPVLPSLIQLSATNKQLSSYVAFEYDQRCGRVHYTLDGCGTETGRWAGYNSGWGEGFNPQTVPKAVRNCFTADPGKRLVQIDLAQAESRYVAWEAPEPALMQMIQEGRDVHKYVASHIFKKPEEIINKQERQLGKKSGHATNYDVGPRTFAESCLVEMNYFIEEYEARRIIATYNTLFPGISRRKANIRAELIRARKLRTPIGRERHFYGRMDDSTFREAYAYCPQSVIPDITNHLMLKLWDERDYLGLNRADGNYFLLQVHDSLLLQCDPDRVQDIADLAHDLKAWHPRITLPGGELWIPVEVEVGERWGSMEVV